MMASRMVKRRRKREFGFPWSQVQTAGHWASWHMPCLPAATPGLKQPATATHTWNIKSGLKEVKAPMMNWTYGLSHKQRARRIWMRLDWKRRSTFPKLPSLHVSPIWPVPFSSHSSTHGHSYVGNLMRLWVTWEETGWWRKRGWGWRRRVRRVEGKEGSETWKRWRGEESVKLTKSTKTKLKETNVFLCSFLSSL